MGKKKQPPPTADTGNPPGDAPHQEQSNTEPGDAPHQEQSNTEQLDLDSEAYAAIKLECDTATATLRGKNHAEALRLIKETCRRHQNSALPHRVQAFVYSQAALVTGADGAKQRHLRDAVQSAQRAAILSPDSIEFGTFHAHCLFDVATDAGGYKEAVRECGRALLIDSPIDPAKEGIQEPSQWNECTAEERLKSVRNDLHRVLQKSWAALLDKKKEEEKKKGPLGLGLARKFCKSAWFWILKHFYVCIRLAILRLLGLRSIQVASDSEGKKKKKKKRNKKKKDQAQKNSPLPTIPDLEKDLEVKVEDALGSDTLESIQAASGSNGKKKKSRKKNKKRKDQAQKNSPLPTIPDLEKDLEVKVEDTLGSDTLEAASDSEGKKKKKRNRKKKDQAQKNSPLPTIPDLEKDLEVKLEDTLGSDTLERAHGKEEVHPSRFLSKKKSETCKSYSGSGSCSHGAKCRFAHHQTVTAASQPEPVVAAVKEAKTRTISPHKLEKSGDSGNSKSIGSKSISSITVTSTDWSPMDDGIEVSLPPPASNDEIPSREAMDAYINGVLDGPSRGKRLPAFAEICPE